LKHQEEDDEGQVMLQSTRKVPPLQDDQHENGFLDTELSGIPAPVALEQQILSVNRRVVAASPHGPEAFPVNHSPTAVTMTERSAPPTQFLWDRVKRAYSAARLWQAKTVRPTGSSSGTTSQINTPSYGLAKQETVIPGYAALVDAAFARDARRYDGTLRIL